MGAAIRNNCNLRYVEIPFFFEADRGGFTCEAEMSQTVAEVLVNALESIGVKHIFGLIGDSLNPLADAVRRSAIE